MTREMLGWEIILCLRRISVDKEVIILRTWFEAVRLEAELSD